MAAICINNLDKLIQAQQVCVAIETAVQLHPLREL